MKLHSVELGVDVLLNAHFLRRQEARENKAAKSAVTDAARDRHLALAAQYAMKAEQLPQAES